MKNRLLILLVIIVVVLAFWAGTQTTQAYDGERARTVEIHIDIVAPVTGPAGVPFEWWGDEQGGVVHLGTGPEFRVFMNGQERFPVPCPVEGGCQ